MANQGRIGIVGATGAVGRAVVAHLNEAGVGPLRLGSRNEESLNASVHPLDGEFELKTVDIEDAASLEGFCAGCAVVVNAAGPTRRVMDKIALACLAVGSDYVDAAGDQPVSALLNGAGSTGKRRLMLSTGMMPGLTSLLPRLLADDLEPPHSLISHIGGIDRFTPAASVDYLDSLSNSSGISGAAWRHGRRTARALQPRLRERMPYFPREVNAFPYLSLENERLAEHLALAEGSWYNVFEGEHFLAALSKIRTSAEYPPHDASVLLQQAAALDIAGRDAYQVLHVQMSGRIGGRPAHRSLLLRVADSYTVTGAVAAFAAMEVLQNTIPPGIHYAADVLDPERMFQWLAASPAVTVMNTFSSETLEDEASAFEDGVL